MESNDVVLDIISYLDALSILRFLSVSRRYWNLRTSQNVTNRLLPYQKYFKYQQWNKGLLEAVKQNNFPQIVFFIEKGADDFNKALSIASQIGNRQLVNYFIKLGAQCWDLALCHAAEGGHKDLVEYYIQEKGAGKKKWIVSAFCRAAKGGHLDLVPYFMERLPTGRITEYLNFGLIHAVEGGHEPVIKFMISQGANDWHEAMHYAARRGDKNLFQFFFKGETCSRCLAAAAFGGNREIVDCIIKLFSKRSRGDWDILHQALSEAVRKGHRPLVQYFLQQEDLSKVHSELFHFATYRNDFLSLKKTYWNAMLVDAADGGHLDLVQLFISKGATDFNCAFLHACGEDHREIIKYLLSKGARPSLSHAATYGHKSLVEYLIQQGATDFEQAVTAATSVGFPKLATFLKTRNLGVILRAV